MRARASGSRRLKPRSSWSRSVIDDVRSPTAGAVDRGRGSTSTRWRRSRRASSMQARYEQPVEPGVEAIGAAQCGQVTPGPDERLLDGVLGLVGIAQDEPGGSVQPEERGACQRGEGVMIAPSALAPRVPAASRPSAAAAPTWPRSMSMARRPPRFVPKCVRATRCDAVPSLLPPRPRRCGARPPVKIQEADAKTLLVAQGLPGPRLGGRPHRRPRRAPRPSGSSPAAPGRSSSRPRSSSAAGARPAASSWPRPPTRPRRSPGRSSAWTSRASPSARCWSRPRPTSSSEFYMSAVLDRAAGRILLMGSAEGGVEIEQVAADHPEAIVRRHADPLLGLLDFQAREFAFAMGLRRPPQGGRGDRQGPRPDDARLRRRPRRDQPAGDRPRDAAADGRAGRAARLPRRQGHARRLRAPPPPGARGRCATPTRRTRPTARRARPA